MATEKEIALKFLRKQEQELEVQLKGIKSTIASLGGSTITPEKTDEAESTSSILSAAEIGEFKKMSQSDQYLMTLKKHNRFMHIKEIGEFVHSVLGKPDGPHDWKTIFGRRTTSLKKDGHIVGKQVGTSNLNFFYGSPKWLDENGEIKLEHMYDKKALTVKKLKVSSVTF